MTISAELAARSSGKCELCAAQSGLTEVEVSDAPPGFSPQVVLCATCQSGLNSPEQVEPHHWRCLTDSMWSSEPAVQVVSARLLKKLSQ